MTKIILFLFILLLGTSCTPSDNSFKEDLGIKDGSLVDGSGNSGTGDTTPPAGPDLIKYSGDLQVINVGALAPIPIGVLAIGLDGSPLAGVSVSFAVIGGATNGTLSSLSGITDALGIATVNYSAGSFIGTVSISAISGYGSQTFTVTTSGLTGYNLNFEPIASGNAQSNSINSSLALPFKVVLTDTNGDPVANTIVRFQPGGGNVGNFGGQSYTDVITNASGIATTTAYTLSTIQGTHTIRARVLSDATVFKDFTATGTVLSTSIIDPANSTLTLSSNTAEADGINVITFTLDIRDTYGNLIPNATYIVLGHLRMRPRAI